MSEAGWMNFTNYVRLHREWSAAAFGDGEKVEGLCKHIASELDEIREDPADLEEWIDVIILAIDGAWRQGYTDAQIASALVDKQLKNRARQWPPIGSVPDDQPIEHVEGQR